MKYFYNILFFIMLSACCFGQRSSTGTSTCSADFDGVLAADTIMIKDDVGYIKKKGNLNGGYLHMIAKNALILEAGLSTTQNPAKDICLRVPGGAFNDVFIKGEGNGFVGIGLLNDPAEKLDINGAIRIRNTSESNSGTIRFDGTDFLGYNGSQWKSLTFNGGFWTQNGMDIYSNNAGQVGIGTTTPNQALHVKDGNVYINNGQLQLSNGNGKSTLTTVANGLSVRGKGNINLLAEGQKDVNIKSDTLDTYVHFDGNSGFVGFGTTSPSAKVHIIAESDDDALRIQTNSGETQLRVFANGAVSIGTNWNIPQAGAVLIEGDVIEIDDVIKIRPRLSTPTNPTKGVMYFDGNSNKLRVWDGSSWKNCW